MPEEVDYLQVYHFLAWYYPKPNLKNILDWENP